MSNDLLQPAAIPADDYSVTRIRDVLGGTLRSYIEAQYHIRDLGLIEERSRLLGEPGSVAQLPYVEASPVYASGPAYADLSMPRPARDLLSHLATLTPGVGVFARPYVHQARALEAFLGRREDLVVATGTGSGKTESFLMPILGQLAEEGARNPASARRHGVRALLLYPMNALVTDQLSRVRRLVGDPRVADRLQAIRGRRVRFGMYTSRTPYPGRPDGNKAERYLQPMFEQFYLTQNQGGTWSEAVENRDRLRPSGRWPCKDLVRFYAADQVTTHTYGGTGPRAGRPYRRQHWDRRLRTQPGDSELLTRHEMQAECPDILITNYSMLEYMLLRPIERSIFAATREWLASDPEASFVLVLDEAHTYRGAGGAEVALLIRRLRARLGIPRERFRCILTSASLGDRPEDRENVVRFARDLTGLPPDSAHRVFLAEGEREVRAGRAPGTPAEAAALAAFDLARFQCHAVGPAGFAGAAEAVRHLAAALRWPAPPAEGLEQYLFDRLTGWGPAEEVLARVTGRATEFAALARAVFPASPPADAERAMDVLLALVTFARFRGSPGDDGRVLMPTRLHLLFRGLPAQFACTSPVCRSRRAAPGERRLLGRLHTQPHVNCDCGARTYELLTHRACGTAFLRGYLEGQSGTFLWHEPSGLIGNDDPGTQLCEVQLLVEPPHPDAIQQREVVEAWLDAFSGRLATTRPADATGWLRVHLPALGPANADPPAPRLLPLSGVPQALARPIRNHGPGDQGGGALLQPGEGPGARAASPPGRIHRVPERRPKVVTLLRRASKGGPPGPRHPPRGRTGLVPPGSGPRRAGPPGARPGGSADFRVVRGSCRRGRPPPPGLLRPGQPAGPPHPRAAVRR